MSFDAHKDTDSIIPNLVPRFRQLFPKKLGHLVENLSQSPYSTLV